MPDYIPKIAFYVALGVVIILAIWAASEYLDAATGLLPGGGEG